ncbi:MAG: multicopper oxidase domain-containing protein, partial [Chloroflexi bacterium]|nr:multicopper oxidase domain-containing protein [Chloroflexota bacterium]
MSKSLTLLASKISRRNLLRAAAAGATVLLTGGIAVISQGCNAQQTTRLAGSSANSITSATFIPEVEIALTAIQSTAQIFAGVSTAVWQYAGKVLKGDPATLQMIPNSYLGPIIRVHKGQKVRISFKNELPEASIIHWHGLIVPPEMDGHPQDVVASGKTYVYEFEVKNRAGTYWYHPHPDQRTGAQVNAGLAGLFIVADEEEAALDLPTAEHDIPLVLQDRLFDDNQQFVYVDAGRGGMMEQMMGFLGNQILVNGQANFHLPLATRVYRLRLLNGSNSRIYKLAWSNHLPLTVIATDGGLLEKPVQRAYVMLAPAERVELWVDLSQQPVGTELKLQSLAYTGIETGMMGGMSGASGLPNGEPFDLLTVHVAKAEAETRILPTKLATLASYHVEEASNVDKPRQIALGMSGMNWTLNDKIFEMEAVTLAETVKLG